MKGVFKMKKIPNLLACAKTLNTVFCNMLSERKNGFISFHSLNI